MVENAAGHFDSVGHVVQTSRHFDGKVVVVFFVSFALLVQELVAQRVNLGVPVGSDGVDEVFGDGMVHGDLA